MARLPARRQRLSAPTLPTITRCPTFQPERRRALGGVYWLAFAGVWNCGNGHHPSVFSSPAHLIQELPVTESSSIIFLAYSGVPFTI